MMTSGFLQDYGNKLNEILLTYGLKLLYKHFWHILSNLWSTIDNLIQLQQETVCCLKYALKNQKQGFGSKN